MVPRTVYAHWLDPEYTSFRWPSGVVRNRLRHVEAVIKLHAILGDTICVSDVQVTDSRVLLELFCDEGFKKFAEEKENKDFLHLVAEPAQIWGAGEQKLQMIYSTLKRMGGKFWTSSTFRNVHVPKTVAEWVERKGPRDAEQFRDILSKFRPSSRLTSEERRLLDGMVKSLKYFSAPDSLVTLPKPRAIYAPRPNYDEVLEDALANPKLEPPLRSQLEATWSFVKRVKKDLPKEAEHARTPVVLALERAGLDNPANSAHLAHVIQAWSLANSGTVQAGRQDAVGFDRAVPLPALHGSVVETTVRVAIADQELFENLYYSWHPADLSWKTISDVRRACSDPIKDLQGQPSAALLDAALKEAANVITTPGNSPPWLLLNSEQGLMSALFRGAGKGVRVVHKAVERIPRRYRLPSEAVAVLAHIVGAGAPVVALAGAAGLADWLLEFAEWEITRRERKKMTDVLKSSAIRYNLIEQELRQWKSGKSFGRSLCWTISGPKLGETFA